MDIRQSKEYCNYLSQTGWVIENAGGACFFIKKIPLFGSVIKLQRPNNINFAKVQEIAIKYKARRIIIEPINQKQVNLLKESNYKLSKSPFLYTKTLVINLQQKKENILSNFKTDARSAIKQNTKYQIQNTKNIEEFYKAWKNNSKSRFHLSSIKELQALKKAFGKNCILLITNNYSAGAIFLKSDDTVYYWKAFTSPTGRKEHSQYKLVWEGILWAKKHNAKVFDFEGIYDERFPLKTWKGFTHFKKSFGGVEKDYPGAFVK